MPRFYDGPDRRYVNSALPTDAEVIDHAISYITSEVVLLTTQINPHRRCATFARIAWDIHEFESYVRTIAMHFNLMKQDVTRGVALTRLNREQMKYLVDLLEDAKSVVHDLLVYGGFTVDQSK